MGDLVAISNSRKNIGRIWLIDEIQVGSSHSVVISISIKKYDDEDTSIEASILFYDMCRFEFSDFLNDAEELKLTSAKLLTGIEGLRKMTTSNYLDETKVKFETRYSNNRNLLHYVIFDEGNIIQVVSESPPKVIFRSDDDASKFIPPKVNKNAH